MKYIIEPMSFALDKNISEREFKIYVNRLILWHDWLEMYPEDVYILRDTSKLLFNNDFYPVYTVFDSLLKKFKIDYVQASHLNRMIGRLLTLSKPIDMIDDKKADDELMFDNLNYSSKIDLSSYPRELQDAFRRLLWYFYCQCSIQRDKPESFVLFANNLSQDVIFDVEYATLVEKDGDLVESKNKARGKVVCRSSLSEFFKDKNSLLQILQQSDDREEITLAVRVALYQNGNLKKVMNAFDEKYKFVMQDTFIKDYKRAHYMNQPSFLSSYIESMSHTLLGLHVEKDREDFRTGEGGNNPQMSYREGGNIWLAWRWKVTESVSYQYWQQDDNFKFANIGEHDYYVCQWCRWQVNSEK